MLLMLIQWRKHVCYEEHVEALVVTRSHVCLEVNTARTSDIFFMSCTHNATENRRINN